MRMKCSTELSLGHICSWAIFVPGENSEKNELKKANFARSSASGSVENLPNDQTKQHGSQQTGRADGDLIRRCLRPKAMRRRVPLRVHDWPIADETSAIPNRWGTVPN